ncbi:MAG: hypothetical protein ABT15_01450 [Pseudonocardia sp. SCN 73-27]|nr:MAG: hypothetical protein ABS80_04060 [Pseudonocardia sp. SCN 72-51]ODV08934.1 MAG: hypothetical protein ABT15_01450 [Pseudonocardia sp. SCN 73-27]
MPSSTRSRETGPGRQFPSADTAPLGAAEAPPSSSPHFGSLARYCAVEARNLAPLPADVDHTVAAALPISGLTAWQALFDHARLAVGQTVLLFTRCRP